MTSYPALVAVTGADEATLVAALDAAREVAVVGRCADLAELLSIAPSGQAVVAFVSADVRGLDRAAVARLASHGLAVVGVASAVGDLSFASADRFAGLGIATCVAADAGPDELLEAAEVAVGARADSSWSVAEPGADADRFRRPGDLPSPAEPGGDGRVVAVWGPAGAPGRTTVAVTLAATLAERGQACMLADADTYGASVAQALGILDEAPGLAAACRAAGTAGLDVMGLARMAPLVGPRLRVLTGITRAARWPELSGSSLSAVWAVCRVLAPWTVIDAGFCLEHDEELSYDTFAPRRNATTLESLEAADHVVAVGSADPVGLQRLIRGLSDLRELAPGVEPLVVVTKLRAGAVGTAPHRRVAEALHRYASVEEVLCVPDDRATLDAAMLAGRSVVEHAPGSAVHLAVRELAATLQVHADEAPHGPVPREAALAGR
ncbi:MAG: CpaE family protein [Actinomycetales bacterium]